MLNIVASKEPASSAGHGLHIRIVGNSGAVYLEIDAECIVQGIDGISIERAPHGQHLVPLHCYNRFDDGLTRQVIHHVGKAQCLCLLDRFAIENDGRVGIGHLVLTPFTSTSGSFRF